MLEREASWSQISSRVMEGREKGTVRKSTDMGISIELALVEVVAGMGGKEREEGGVCKGGEGVGGRGSISIYVLLSDELLI